MSPTLPIPDLKAHISSGVAGLNSDDLLKYSISIAPVPVIDL